MEPLEALLAVEKEALMRPAKDEYEETRTQFLPYVKHQPYFYLLSSRGRLLSYESMLSQESPAEPFVESFTIVCREREKKYLSKREEKVREAVSEISRRYGIEITHEDVERYLLGLAGRILNFAKARLPGIFDDNPELAALFSEESPISSYTITDLREDLFNIASNLATNPDRTLKASIEHIATFFKSTIENR